jgi:hypothetical protein
MSDADAEAAARLREDSKALGIGKGDSREPITLTADEIRDLMAVQGILGTSGWTGLQSRVRSIIMRADPDGEIVPKRRR